MIEPKGKMWRIIKKLKLFSKNIFLALVSALLLSTGCDDNEISELSDKFDYVGAMVMVEGRGVVGGLSTAAQL